MPVEMNQEVKPDQTSTEAQVKKRVFSGIQPTGKLHLGNYLGALRNWKETQAQYDNIFCIVDLHAITVPIDPKELHHSIRQLAALYLACGLDTRYCKLFVQSHVHQHAEMSWIMNCYTPMGWLNRMTQFKSKAGENRHGTSTGRNPPSLDTKAERIVASPGNPFTSRWFSATPGSTCNAMQRSSAAF